MPEGIGEGCKLQEMFHKALELFPSLWIKAGFLDEAVTAYRRALVKPPQQSPSLLKFIQNTHDMSIKNKSHAHTIRPARRSTDIGLFHLK